MEVRHLLVHFLFSVVKITENRGDLRGLQPRKRYAKYLNIFLCPLISPKGEANEKESRSKTISSRAY